MTGISMLDIVWLEGSDLKLTEFLLSTISTSSRTSLFMSVSLWVSTAVSSNLKLCEYSRACWLRDLRGYVVCVYTATPGWTNITKSFFDTDWIAVCTGDAIYHTQKPVHCVGHSHSAPTACSVLHNSQTFQKAFWEFSRIGNFYYSNKDFFQNSHRIAKLYENQDDLASLKKLTFKQ